MILSIRDITYFEFYIHVVCDITFLKRYIINLFVIMMHARIYKGQGMVLLYLLNSRIVKLPEIGLGHPCQTKLSIGIYTPPPEKKIVGSAHDEIINLNKLVMATRLHVDFSVYACRSRRRGRGGGGDSHHLL